MPDCPGLLRAPRSTMQIARREIAGVLVLSFTEPVELEGEESRRFRDKLRGIIDEGRRNVVVDLGGVAFIDSSGLGALISGLKVLRQCGGDLRLACVPPVVREVLSVTRLNRILEVHERVEDALNAAQVACPGKEEKRP